MLIELGSIAGFIGLLFLVGWKLLILSNTDNYKNPPYSPWFSLLTMVGMVLCWGIFFVAYMSSFQDSTTITQVSSDTITISNSNYFILTNFMPIINGLFAIGMGLAVIEFILFIGIEVFKIAEAKNSNV